MNNLSDQDLGWVAGILEGEGCFDSYRPSTIRVRVQMTDEDTIRRLASVTGIGTVYYCPPRQNHHKPSWCWTVRKRADVVDLMLAVQPLMGTRRAAQITDLLAA